MLSDTFNPDFILQTGLIALLAVSCYKWSTLAKHRRVSVYGQWVVFGKPQVIRQLCLLSAANSITSLPAHFC